MQLELERPQRWLEPPWGMSQDWSLTMTDSKTCSKCGQILPLDSFSPNPAGRPGLRSDCKPCRAAYTKAWSSANKERKAIADKNWRLQNPERYKTRQKEYQIKNKEKLKIKSQIWAQNNREKTKEIKRNWDLKNPNSRRQKLLRYRARKAQNAIFVITKKDIKNLYASACFFCGTFQDIEADHIIPTARGGRHSIGNLMPLCRGCNASKSDKFIMEYKLWKRRIDSHAQNNSMGIA